jgi:hypothetical protein
MTIFPSFPVVTLWSIKTRSSVVSCRFVRSVGGTFELQLTQGEDIVVTQSFIDEESLRTYADALRDRLKPLGTLQSKNADPDWKAS